MAALILFLVLSAGLQVGASDLDTAFNALRISSLASKSFQESSDAVSNLYQLYKKEFNRASTTTTEETTRFAFFNDTVYTLLKSYQQGDNAYTVGLNKYTDWTPEELQKLRGAKPPQDKSSSTSVASSPNILTLDGKTIQTKATVVNPPASYDYRNLSIPGTSTPSLLAVKDQGQCGSCWAFAFIALLEYQYALQFKISANLSEQQMVDCSFYDAGCNGGYFTSTISYLNYISLQVNSEITYPYKAVTGKCAFNCAAGAAVKFGSLGYYSITPNNPAAMQQYLYTYGPLWVTIFAGSQTNATYSLISSKFNSYTGGIMQFTGCPTSVSATNHAVVIVGYGTDASTTVPYWVVRNSWGKSWGEQGYFRIKRGVNMCGIESGPFFIAKT